MPSGPRTASGPPRCCVTRPSGWSAANAPSAPAAKPRTVSPAPCASVSEKAIGPAPPKRRRITKRPLLIMGRQLIHPRLNCLHAPTLLLPRLPSPPPPPATHLPLATPASPAPPVTRPAAPPAPSAAQAPRSHAGPRQATQAPRAQRATLAWPQHRPRATRRPVVPQQRQPPARRRGRPVHAAHRLAVRPGLGARPRRTAARSPVRPLGHLVGPGPARPIHSSHPARPTRPRLPRRPRQSRPPRPSPQPGGGAAGAGPRWGWWPASWPCSPPGRSARSWPRPAANHPRPSWWVRCSRRRSPPGWTARSTRRRSSPATRPCARRWWPTTIRRRTCATLSSPSALKASGVVVVTPVALQLFGSSLVTAWAPAALATFGSGSSTVSVRIVAPDGATAYERAAREDQAVRASSEASLTRSQEHHDHRACRPGAQFRPGRRAAVRGPRRRGRGPAHRHRGLRQRRFRGQCRRAAPLRRPGGQQLPRPA